jgi:hypothetical protein
MAPSNETLADRIENLKDDINELKLDVRFLMRAVWWAAGALVGFGALLGLAVPKIMEVLGLS